MILCFPTNAAEARCIVCAPKIGIANAFMRKAETWKMTIATRRGEDRMAGQFAIVTGASSGIGLSLAKELAARGYDLAVCSSVERLRDAAEELRSEGALANVTPGNVKGTMHEKMARPKAS
jgi:hypothetical protein